MMSLFGSIRSAQTTRSSVRLSKEKKPRKKKLVRVGSETFIESSIDLESIITFVLSYYLYLWNIITHSLIIDIVKIDKPKLYHVHVARIKFN